MIHCSKIIIYLFNTLKTIEIYSSSFETVRDLKYKIIQKINESKDPKINNCVDAYLIRLIDDDEEKPNMDFPPLGDTVRIMELMPQKLAFLVNSEYISDLELKRHEVTVFYNYKGNKEKRKIKFSGKENLRNILNYFFEHDFLGLKNLDYYFFVEHKEEKNIDNASKMDR